MAEGKGRKPSHRIVVQHDPDDDKRQTEIGAMWPHKTGGGFSIMIKPGLAAVGMDPDAGIRIVAFKRNDEEKEEEGGGRRSGRSRNRARGRDRKKSRDDDPGPSDGDAPGDGDDDGY